MSRSSACRWISAMMVLASILQCDASCIPKLSGRLLDPAACFQQNSRDLVANELGL